jgi:polyphosphate kinase 2 (PPK2 family)
MKKLSLSHTLKKMKVISELEKEKLVAKIPDLQLEMLKIQQGLYHSKERAIIMFEGFDAAGKGGAIKTLTENLDPRGFRVHPIGAPTEEEQGKHWLYRFWSSLPQQGNIAIFDRSWYGRVLVERVERIIPHKRIEEAYGEINQFEKMLEDDGIRIIKIFIAITKDEQLERFEVRLSDPYKQWKITDDDIRARKNWNEYVKATDIIFKHTDTKQCPWHLVEGNSKKSARYEVLKIITHELRHHGKWIDKKAGATGKLKIEKALRKELH